MLALAGRSCCNDCDGITVICWPCAFVMVMGWPSDAFDIFWMPFAAFETVCTMLFGVLELEVTEEMVDGGCTITTFCC